MFFSSILVEYITWHYTSALSSYVRIVRNGRDFILYYFSIPLLLRTLLSPYKRVVESRSRRFSFEDLVGRIVINTLSRLIGLVMRLIIIAWGLLAYVLFMMVSVLGFAVWLASPLLVLMAILSGVIIIISSSI